MNRNPIKQWEITFPQSTGVITKDKFHESFPPCKYSICCEEEHSDGGLHLHLGILLIKGISHSKLIKWLEKKWPNDWKRIHISAIRSWDHFNDYVKKEDPTPFVTGTLGKRVSKLQTEFENAAKAAEFSRRITIEANSVRDMLYNREKEDKIINTYKEKRKMLEAEANKVEWDEFLHGKNARECWINDTMHDYM